jgi:hypothetical protein
MRFFLLAVGLNLSSLAYGDVPVFDRDLAVAVAKPYVEAYLRWHHVGSAGAIAWDRVEVKFMPDPDSPTTKGVVGVFFPETNGPGVGFACFDASALRIPEQLWPRSFGYGGTFAQAIGAFERRVANRQPCVTGNDAL